MRRTSVTATPSIRRHSSSLQQRRKTSDYTYNAEKRRDSSFTVPVGERKISVANRKVSEVTVLGPIDERGSSQLGEDPFETSKKLLSRDGIGVAPRHEKRNAELVDEVARDKRRTSKAWGDEKRIECCSKATILTCFDDFLSDGSNTWEG
jgi:hypothetical protein